MSPLVLVVGAGINGAAVARELTLNGISVVAVDANDIAFGATSRSSRLIHGGLRYLERGDVALVRESLRERAILLKTAPDFVRPLRLRIPVRRRFGGLIWSVLTFFGGDRSWLGRFWLRCFPNARERGFYLVRLGLWLYDRLAGSTVGWDKLASSAGPPLHDQFGGPALRWSHPTFPYVCEYFDAQILSPERFTIALLDDARQLAREQSLAFDVHTHTLAEFHEHEVRLIDRLGRNAPITLRPDVIINATGAWGDATLADWRIGSQKLFGGTKGSHFVTANRDLRVALGDGGLYAEASDGRMVFVLPFGDEQTLVGTTDEPFDARPETAVAEPREINYLIDLVNEVVPFARLTREDVVMSYSGVRPLPFGRTDSPSSIPRGHWIDENARGPIPILTLIGGKLTTCRALAEEVANRVLSHLRLPRLVSSHERPLRDPRGVVTRTRSASFEVAQFSREATVEDSCGREPAEIGGKEFKAAERREQFVAAVAASRLCVPFPLLSVGFRPRLSAFAASAAENCATSKSASEGALASDVLHEIIRHEWVRTLSDLVERRLLLIFDPTLDQPKLRELATLMAEEGVVSPDQIDSQVVTTATRLRQVYGIDVGGS
jgi:glycerol-3-phosphate dehydrogenase